MLEEVFSSQKKKVWDERLFIPYGFRNKDSAFSFTIYSALD
ncbi:hypothetical protein [Nostoc sp.]